jgi:hypothetical protein
LLFIPRFADAQPTLAAKQAIQKALLSITRKTFTEINKVLGIK